MTSAKAASAKTPMISYEALILQILNTLPKPGGPEISYQNLESMTSNPCVVDWESMPRSCDPVFVLDNPANSVRRKGNLEERMSQMVLGRPGESSSRTEPLAPVTSKGRQSRGAIKRWQVESFAVVLQYLLHDREQPLHVVDFGCGTGTLLLPLAAMFPHCRFTGVEMKPAAVALLLERARTAGLSNVAAVRGMIEEFTEQPFDVALALHACGNATDAAMQLAARRRAAYVVSPCCVGKLKFALAGGSSFSSSVRAYTPRLPGDPPPSRKAAPPDATGTNTECEGSDAARSAIRLPDSSAASTPEGVPPGLTAPATPAEGESTAVGMAASIAKSGPIAEPQLVAPALGAQSVTLGEVRHPRSAWLREQLPEPETHFRIMAKVADQNHSNAVEKGDGEATDGSSTVAAAAARACKAHVELDRNLAAKEQGYRVGMFKCFHWRDMAKSDLLVGVPAERQGWEAVGSQVELAPVL